MERRLEELAKAWHGKVKFMSSQGTAVLKFENGDKANRALKIMQGEFVGKRRIQVNFNKRLNFVNTKRSQSVSPSPAQPGAGRWRPRPVAQVRAFTSTSNNASSIRAVTATEDAFLNDVNSDDDGADVFVVDVEESAAEVSENEESKEAPATSLTSGDTGPRRERHKQQQQLTGRVFLPLRVERDLNSQRRKVKPVFQKGNDNGSRNEEEACAYDSATTTSSGCLEDKARPTRRRRRRSRKRNPMPEALEERLDSFMIGSVRDGNVTDVVDVPPPVVVVISNIVTQAKESAVERSFRAALADRRVFYTAIAVKRIPNNDDESSCCQYECRIEFEEADTAQTVVNFMSAFPYGREKLMPQFEDYQTAVKARTLNILKNSSSETASLKDLKSEYGAKFGRQDLDAITVDCLKSMPQLEVRNLGGFDVRVALRSRRAYASTAAVSLPLPFKSLILPCVKTTLDNLKERLQKAVASYAPYGIPYSKLLSALNTPVVNRDDQVIREVPAKLGGVPLEQLVEAVGVVRLEQDSYGEYKFVPRGANQVKASGSVEMKKVERLVSLILQEAPYRRMKRQELERKFHERHEVSLESVCRQFGGVCKILGTDESSAIRSSFSVIGLGDAAEVVYSHARAKTMFIIALRRILAALDGDAEGKSLAAETQFARLYETVLSKGRPFMIARYGVCSVLCMWSALKKTKQNLVHMRENSVKYTKEFLSFLNNSRTILSTEMLPAEEFDSRYCRKFGEYRISPFTYSSIEECFEELPDFSVCPKTGFLGQSPPARIKLLTQQIFSLLLHSPEGRLSSQEIYAAYLREHYVDLEVTMKNLNMRDIEDLCSKLPPNTGIICTRFGGSESIYLENSTFINNFEKRVVSLLWQQPKRGFETFEQFLTAYAKCYGPECFLSVAHVKKNMAGRVLDNGVYLMRSVAAVVGLAQRLLYNGAVSVSEVDDPCRMREWIRLIPDVRG